MGLKERLQRQIETADAHKNKTLRTHYYAATVEMLFAGIEAAVAKEGGNVRRKNAERGELSFEAEGLDGLATVVTVAPGRTAVDLFLHREGLLGPDLLHWVEAIYSGLDASYRLKMIGTQEVN